jgi:hypothetical protein
VYGLAVSRSGYTNEDLCLQYLGLDIGVSELAGFI